MILPNQELVMNLKDLGQRIRAARDKCRLKQNDLARALQVSPQAVSKWERGENAPDIALLPGLCRLLHVSADFLLRGSDGDQDVFEATVAFLAVQNAREMSETLPPREFATWTNAACLSLTEAVLRHDGVPIKYAGPGLLCFFSGMDHSLRAVRAVLAARSLVTSPLKAGLSAGPIYYGPIGHPDYAQGDVMGEPVTIARLVAGWAATHSSSGVAAGGQLAGLSPETIRFGKRHTVQFEGIAHKLAICEIRDLAEGDQP
jgi:transcriptional regulator with XRE-family HTH domain